MITREEAIERVNSLVNEFDPDWPTRPKRTIFSELTVEKPWGWGIFYGGPEELRGGLRGERPEGNPRVIGNRRTGELEPTSLEQPLDYYIKRYEHRL